MKTNYLLGLSIAVALAIGCTKEEIDPAKEYTAPAISTNNLQVNIPAALSASTDQNVMQITGYAELINGFNSYTSIIATIPANAEYSSLKSSGQSWTWSSQGNTIYLEYRSDSLQRNWKYYLKTTQMLDKKLVLETTENSNGTQGTLLLYDFESMSTDPMLNYQWQKDNKGNLNATAIFVYKSSAMYLQIISNADKSGLFKAYLGLSKDDKYKFADINWNSAGKGHYWIKDPNAMNASASESDF